MFDDINNLKKDILEYFEVRWDLIKLQFTEDISHILSSTASFAIIGFLLFFVFMFLSMAAGYFFAARFNSNELGFLCVAGFYFLLLLLFILFKKQIIEKPIIRSMVSRFFPKHADDEKK